VQKIKTGGVNAVDVEVKVCAVKTWLPRPYFYDDAKLSIFYFLRDLTPWEE